MTKLRSYAVGWVSDEPWPGWVEVQFRGSEGALWRLFDKPPVFLGPGDPHLSSSTPYPVELRLPVTVHSVRQGREAEVVRVSLWSGLQAQLTDDTVEVPAEDLIEAE